jgi:hypothetical protein
VTTRDAAEATIRREDANEEESELVELGSG